MKPLRARLAAIEWVLCLVLVNYVVETLARLDYFTVVQVNRVEPHDPHIFTEGLAISEGELFESSGLWGFSGVIARRLSPNSFGISSNQSLKKIRPRVFPLPKNLFGEGIAVWGPVVFQLTYREGLAIVYDKTRFPRAGEALSTRTYPPPRKSNDIFIRRKHKRAALRKYLKLMRQARIKLSSPPSSAAGKAIGHKTEKSGMIDLPYPGLSRSERGGSQEGWGLASGPTLDQLQKLAVSGIVPVASLSSNLNPATQQDSQQEMGIAIEESLLYASDGSPRIRLIDPARFQDAGTLQVHNVIDPTKPAVAIAGINELEFVLHPELGVASAISSVDHRHESNDDQHVAVGIAAELWGNIGRTDCIVRIDPHTGLVKGFIWASGLDEVKHRSVNLFNGIGFDLSQFVNEVSKKVTSPTSAPENPNKGPSRSWDDEQEELLEKAKRTSGISRTSPLVWQHGEETVGSVMISHWLTKQQNSTYDKNKVDKDEAKRLKVLVTGKLWPKLFNISPIGLNEINIFDAVADELEFSQREAPSHPNFEKGFSDHERMESKAHSELQRWQAHHLAKLFVRAMKLRMNKEFESSLRNDRGLLEKAVGEYFGLVKNQNAPSGFIDPDTGMPLVCTPGFGYSSSLNVRDNRTPEGLTYDEVAYQTSLVKKGPIARDVEMKNLHNRIVK